MSSVNYPIVVKQYQVSIARDAIRITLEGIEGVKEPVQQTDFSIPNLRTVGYMTFSDSNLDGNQDFFTRDGVLKMDRPMTMFPSILHLLQHTQPLFLHRDGSLSTALDFIYRTRA